MDVRSKTLSQKQTPIEAVFFQVRNEAILKFEMAARQGLKTSRIHLGDGLLCVLDGWDILLRRLHASRNHSKGLISAATLSIYSQWRDCLNMRTYTKALAQMTSSDEFQISLHIYQKRMLQFYELHKACIF